MTSYHPCDHHLLVATSVALIIADLNKLLPQSDLVCQVNDLISAQIEVLTTHMQGEHYGTKDLDKLMSQVRTIKHQIGTMQNAAKKR